MRKVELKDPNQNPWYILMTLHGEQEGDEIDWELHEKNRKLWNAWACQGMNDEEREKLAKSSRVSVAEMEWSDAIEQDVLALFMREFVKRNAAQPITPKIPKPAAAIDLTGVRFSKTYAIKGAIFVSTIICTSAVFRKDASFVNVTFKGDADFGDARFEGSANFDKTTFSDDVSFNNAKFVGQVVFDSATFECDAFFISAKFGLSAQFRAATFMRNAGFGGAEFNGDAEFPGTRFNGNAEFGSTIFIAAINFAFARFKELADFSSSLDPRGDDSLLATFGPSIDFSDIHCEKRADFNNRRFGPYEGSAEVVTFENAIFDGPVSFDGAIFPHLLPKLSNATLPQLTKLTADPAHWPNIPSPWELITRNTRAGWKDAIQVKASSATLRYTMSRQGLPEEEHFFFRYEMNAAALIGGFLQRLPYILFSIFSDFGHSIFRPLLWLLGIVTVCWLAYGAQFAWGAVLHDGMHTSDEALALSFSNTFSFLGFQRLYFGVDYINTLPVWMRVCGAAQTVVGVILLFFLGLGLRTRFRLR